MRQDYKVYLSKIAKQMTLIHDANILAKLVVKTLVRTLNIKTAGMFIHNKLTKEYVIKVSSGKDGFKIPEGFTKISEENSIIKFFLNKNEHGIKDEYVSKKSLKKIKKQLKNDVQFINIINELEDEMDLYDAELIMPGFFKDELLLVFFISAKKDNTTFPKKDIDFLNVLALDVVIAMQNAQLFENIKKQLDLKKQLLLNTVETLATAMDIKNPYTQGHSERVMKYSMTLLKYIPHSLVKDYNDFENSLQISALLHDIGKIGIPENILNKDTMLSSTEFDFIKKHPSMGAEILEPIEEFKIASLGVKYHHERFDGTGYPYGLSGKDIPLIATIISVADSYDAMLGDRPYRKGLDRNIAIKEIETNRNKQFDPIVVDAFLKAVSNKEI